MAKYEHELSPPDMVADDMRHEDKQIVTERAGDDLKNATGKEVGSDEVSSRSGSFSKQPRKRGFNFLKWNPPPIPKVRSISTERSANWFSQALFLFMDGLMRVGYKRHLEIDDLPLVPPARKNRPNTDRVAAEFKKRVARGDKHPLLGALNGAFFWEFWLGGMAQLLAIVLMMLSPLMLKYLILYATDRYYDIPAPEGRGIGLAIGVIIMQIISSIGINQFIFRALICGGMARGTLISMIYAKSQVISARARAGGNKKPVESKQPVQKSSGWKFWQKEKKEPAPIKDQDGWSNGRVSNLMSTDTYRIDQAATWAHILWITPVQIAIALVQLIVNIGPSALAGFALLAIMTPLITFTTRLLAKRRGAANKITDKRISLTQELFQSIRFVKYFAWEESFLEDLDNLRTAEIKQVRVLLGARSVITAIAMSLPIFAAILSFLTYSLTHKGFGAAEIFSSLALFNTLRMPLNMLPMVIGMSIDAWVSLGRVEEYLLAEEEQAKVEVEPSLKEAIILRDASFSWETTKKPDEDAKSKPGEKPSEKEKKAQAILDAEKSSEQSDAPFELKGLNLSIARDELIAIVGPVGCGKTSLLAAISGEMRRSGGIVQQGANIGLCPQYAWIQNATVQDNIVFGKEYDPKWYREVVSACALKPDFKSFSAGDQTEIGERGITLSGGQKQRISIARAIYFNAPIVVLDDPLSAVDAHVGRHIFDSAICGLLSGKCRILATHQLHVLSRCDRVVFMLNGNVEAIGTFQHLMENHQGFVEMMALTAAEEKAKEPGEENDDEAIDAAERQKLTRMNTQASEKQAPAATLMQSEEKAVDAVKWSVYQAYIKASGSYWLAPLVILMCCLAQSSNIVASVWLSYWTGDTYNFSTGEYIGVYAALGFAQAVFMCGFAVTLTMGGTQASKTMLHSAIERTLRAPMSFFDTTPLGRVINRFSKDVDVMDNFLTEAMRMYFFTVATVVSIFILIIVYFPYFVAAIVPLAFVLYFMADFYRSSGREIKRHEAVLRSTVFSVFGEAINGTAPIRAYGVQSIYRDKLEEHIDEMNSAYYLTFAAQCWLSVRLDLIGNMLALITCLLVVTGVTRLAPGTAGLILTYVLQVVGMIQFAIRQLAEVENSMNSTERILYYAEQIPSEILSDETSLVKPSPSWPEKGDINFVDVEMRYRDGLPLVLRGLSLNVTGGERVGVVGRTGAGKSSIMSCLFRLVELTAGRIEIDGVDVAKIALKDLRSRISIIPQDPTLFKGTIRSNLDPTGKHSDLELWQALRSAHLIGEEAETETTTTSRDLSEKPSTSTSTTGTTTPPAQQVQAPSTLKLDTPVTEEGHNFSLGQRQLMALARALLRNSRIIICDEATSSVDEATDRAIQRTMAKGFRGKTLLCIAHRLRTIINYDRVVVLDQGRIAEVGAPYELWRREGSVFRSICDKSRIREEDFEESGVGSVV